MGPRRTVQTKHSILCLRQDNTAPLWENLINRLLDRTRDACILFFLYSLGYLFNEKLHRQLYSVYFPLYILTPKYDRV